MINELNAFNMATVNTPDEVAAHTTISAAGKASILIEALPYIQKIRRQNHGHQIRWQCHD